MGRREKVGEKKDEQISAIRHNIEKRIFSLELLYLIEDLRTYEYITLKTANKSRRSFQLLNHLLHILVDKSRIVALCHQNLPIFQ